MSNNESTQVIIDEEKVKAAAAAAGVIVEDDDDYVPANGFLKVFDVLRKIIESFCKICLIGQVIVTTIVVAGRYLFSYTPGWGEELSLMLMVYFCLCSACLPVRNDEHLRMTLIEKVVPAKAVLVMDIIGYLCMFVFGLFMLTSGIDLIQLGARSRLSGLTVTRAWLYASVAISGASLCLSVIEKGVLLCLKR